MNSRQRFLKTLLSGEPDRVPLFREGIRPGVLANWREAGLPAGVELENMFLYDHHEEIITDLGPSAGSMKWPLTRAGLRVLSRDLDASDPARLPIDWGARFDQLRERDHALLLRVHEGFFISMGVDGWERFMQLMDLLIDDPSLVQSAMQLQGEFASRMAERILNEVDVDAAVFSEPIGGNHGPLISPTMYRDLVLTSYRPIIEVLRRHQVEVIILRTYANSRVLLPGILDLGINTLWACECETEVMDYRRIRGEFGRDLGLIGGIDLDLVRRGGADTVREMMDMVPPLLESGRYIPLADGRVREDIPFGHYADYRRLLEQLVSPS